jgi:hypothetical protein
MQSIDQNDWLYADKWPNVVFIFPNGFSPVRNADTLHVVGSYHDPTTFKVSAQYMLIWPSRAAPDAMVVVLGIRLNPRDSFRIRVRNVFSNF